MDRFLYFSYSFWPMLNGKFHEHYFCRFMVQSEQEQDDPNLCQIPFDDLSSGQMGMVRPFIIPLSW